MATVNLTYSVPDAPPQTPFANEPFIDFTTLRISGAMLAALSEVESNLAGSTTS